MIEANEIIALRLERGQKSDRSGQLFIGCRRQWKAFVNEMTVITLRQSYFLYSPNILMQNYDERLPFYLIK